MLPPNVVARDVLWIMLNPSTADGDVDDPTIRRCVGFSRRWGFGGLMVVNLFAYRCTKPAQLPKGPLAVGVGNDETIQTEAAKAGRIICAWGAHPAATRRGPAVLDRLAAWELFALGTTKVGHPRHPLFLPDETPLQEWP